MSRTAMWIIVLAVGGAAFLGGAVLLTMCESKRQAPVPPAWSLNVWASTSLPRVELPAHRDGLVRTQESFHALQLVLDPNLELDLPGVGEEVVLAHRNEIEAFMELAPRFASLKDSTVARPGMWIIGGEETPCWLIELSRVSINTWTLVRQPGYLKSVENRARVQAFALALIALGEEVGDIQVSPNHSNSQISEREQLLATGYSMLDLLDKQDGGRRLLRDAATINGEVHDASHQETERRRLLRHENDPK